MNKNASRFLIIGVIIAIVVLFQWLNLGQYLTLETLKIEKDNLDALYQAQSATVILLYFVIYVLTTALSLPGAAILTLAGGALFGLPLGVLIVSFASSLGATLAFLVARFLLKDAVQSKFKEKLVKINEGIKKEGAFYLFTLRMIPVFPFFLVNLVMGLTPIKVSTFYIVSQLGMLLGTIAYVNAGTQLSQINSLKEILSLNVLASFVILGVLPLISKSLISFFRAKKVYRNFKKPKKFDYNIVTIGAGSGGLVASYIAAAVKAKVLLIEKHKMGGDCLNTGCVPSKALIKTAKFLHDCKRSKELGIKSATVEFEFMDVMNRIKKVIHTIEPHDSVERYTRLGVECQSGEARIISPYEVEVNGKKVTTKNIVIATGASPFIPPIEAIHSVSPLTSDTLWELKSLPKRLLVLGGGPIGCELAQCFRRLGSEVIQVEKAPHLMGKEDIDVSEFIEKQFRSESITVLTSHEAKRFEVHSGKKVLICTHQNKEVRIEFDEVLLALGRKPNVKGFGLEELGVEIAQNGTIAHDEFLRTNFPNLYVCGDVAGPYQFTHTASHQAWFAAVNSLFSPLKKFKADYRVIPWATFTDPEVARVGLNESEAKKKEIPYELTTYGIDDLDRAIADEEAVGFIKVLTPPGKDKILGATIVGAHSSDLIIEFIAAMKQGFGLNQILGTIHIYPTLAESNKYLAGNWKKNHAPEKALKLLEKFHAWRRGSSS